MAPLKSDNEPVLEKFTDKDELIRLRDTEQNSWAQVAKLLGLGSPGAARRMYSAVVRPHTESVLEGRTSQGGRVQPVHLADANLTTVRNAVVGKTIVVQRKGGTEDIHVAKVTSVKDGSVTFNDGNKTRTVKAEAIIATK